MHCKIAFIILGSYLTVFSQDVKIESSTSNSELLRVQNTGTSNKTAIRVYNYVGSPPTGQGIHIVAGGNGLQAEANGYNPSGVNQAVFAYATNSSYNIGVNSTGGSGSDGLSGLFQGNVVVNGTFTNPSDAMFKSNVENIEGSLPLIMALKPRRYTMKTAEYKGKVNLPKGRQYGLIAQEAQSVIPDLVHNVKVPLSGAKPSAANSSEMFEYKSVDYISLVPILLAAIQEQQRQIEELKVKVRGN